MDRKRATELYVKVYQGQILSQAEKLELSAMGINADNLGMFTDFAPMNGLIDLEIVAQEVGVDVPTQADWEMSRVSVKPRNRVIFPD